MDQTYISTLRSFFDKKDNDTSCRLCKQDMKAAKGIYSLFYSTSLVFEVFTVLVLMLVLVKWIYKLGD